MAGIDKVTEGCLVAGFALEYGNADDQRRASTVYMSSRWRLQHQDNNLLSSMVWLQQLLPDTVWQAKK